MSHARIRPPPPYSPRRVYLRPGENLHAAAECSVCGSVHPRTDCLHRRYLPLAELADVNVLDHLERCVLGRWLDFGDPTRTPRIPLASLF